jgi:hypothetical protein
MTKPAPFPLQDHLRHFLNHEHCERTLASALVNAWFAEPSGSLVVTWNLDGFISNSEATTLRRWKKNALLTGAATELRFKATPGAEVAVIQEQRRYHRARSNGRGSVVTVYHVQPGQVRGRLLFSIHN